MLQRVLLCLWAFFAANLSSWTLTAAEPDTRVYELNVYTAAEGKWDQLQAHVNERIKLFEKNGATNIGAWIPLEGDEKKIVLLLSYDNINARTAAGQAFADMLASFGGKKAVQNQPATEAAAKQKSIYEVVSGKGLTAQTEEHLLTATDFSPALNIADKGPRVFELRTYTATPGNLPNLLARFRDHTVKLFEKHGMTNIGYWVPIKGSADADTTLIYLLAHKDRDAAKASFAAFGKDPEWQEAKKASEVQGNGPLTIKGGVQSLFLKPVEFSKLK